jgi:hypothetical protein
MRPSQTIALIAMGLAIAGCSSEPSSVVGASLSGGMRFEHRAHERNDGKTMLIVTPVRGVAQDQTIIADEARTYAENFAGRTCPKGYNFYGDSPVGSSRKGEHTYTFQCNQ